MTNLSAAIATGWAINRKAAVTARNATMKPRIALFSVIDLLGVTENPSFSVGMVDTTKRAAPPRAAPGSQV
jgi:hypothetical protein